ncbi:MAG TPA: Rnf-Nqr domain containing protein [Anaerohalosphaeraceae bacterium]|jgi:Na+-transporting NADH:ubiquinone oxidoreductase subunit D|nr:Rnf-Nqr domain containing protein [Anaerohalosphaeraceae bacterium]HRT49716.1 Rnf-Nqr domain containing protein [Anaerohalosphaeraceae bacterium]HRT87652.1 Rnf-Nqr domain containing protein [Anaerohalosphaeraceae bacterium]
MSPNGAPAGRQIIIDGLWHNNPVFRQVLGICSTLAVTNLVLNTLVMCAALTLVLAASCLTVSLLRRFTPRNIRMMVQTLIIAFYVIIVDTSLKGYWPEMSTALGPYVGLIITNCIIMGRCEAFAGTSEPIPAMIDGFFNGLGYSVLLLAIALPRELLGMGSILGIPMPYFSTGWDRWIIMVMPPGAFFMLAVFVWICRSIKPRQETAQ